MHLLKERVPIWAVLIGILVGNFIFGFVSAALEDNTKSTVIHLQPGDRFECPR